jgi:DNA transformation protein and related proteins
MSTDQKTIDFILDQMSAAGHVSAKKMFGEYAIYCDHKIVALVCDDQLFVKPTTAGRAFMGEVEEAPAYAGAKPSFLIDGDKWDDGDYLSHLIRITASELPLPKPKPAKKTKSSRAK